MKNRRHGTFGLLLALLCPAAEVAAQGHRLTFEHLSVEQGLSQATVMTILQDRRGFLWIGTQDGLNRYDGYGFKVYKHDAGDPGSLRSNTIYAILEDSDGVMWIGTWEGGLHRYDRAAGSFTHFRNRPGDATSLSHDTVRAILQDRHGTLWIGTVGGGLNRLDGVATDAAGTATATFTRYRHDPEDPTSLSDDFVRALYEDRSGALWIGTVSGGLNLLDRATGEFTTYRHEPGDPRSLSSDAVMAILQDQAGNLWITTRDAGLNRFHPDGTFTTYRHDPGDPMSLSDDRLRALHEQTAGVLWVGTDGGGLNRFEVETGESLRFRHDPGDARSLSSDALLEIYEDPSGTLWLGTEGGGVDRLDLKAQKFALHRHEPGDPSSLGNDFVLSLLEDRAGELWIGTCGGGLDRFDRRTGVFTHYRPDPDDPRSLGSDTVYAILEDRSGNLWCGPSGAGLARFDRATGAFVAYRHDPENPRSLGDDHVMALYEDPAGRLWIGTWTGGLNRLDAGSLEPDRATFTRYVHADGDPGSLSGNRVYAIHQDREGALWVSTEAHGLNRLDGASLGHAGGSFEHFVHDEADPGSLSNNDVMVITEDRAGDLWIGTYGGGLNLFDRDSETFDHYDQRHGLANNVVYGILEDASGRLWLSTNQGLSRFDPQTETFRNYDVADGLQGMEFNSGAYHRNARGVLYFGGNHGFNAIVPERVTDNPYVPPVVLTSFKKLGEEADLGVAVSEVEAITLGPEDRIVSFEFAALSFTSPYKNRYAYRLEGFHDDWIELGTKRDITLTNLNPGSYVFRVKGSNNDGVWNHEGLAIDLEVLPPFWATWWFRAGSALALGLGVVAVYRIRTRRVKARNRQLEAVNRELEAKNLQLERFSYTVSHDLKTPLVTIKGFLGLLQKDALAGNRERLQHDVDRIGSAADKMARLLDELLELSRIGRMVNPSEPVPLTDLAQEAVALVAGKIEKGGARVEVEPSMPVVDGDRLRLLEVFQNLIDNAVTYMGEQPRPQVEVRAQARDKDVLCSVSDNGAGIDPQYHRKIFGLFERLSAGREGTGIGLTLVERIVEIHGGRIWVESEGKGKGATFYFTLPASEG